MSTENRMSWYEYRQPDGRWVVIDEQTPPGHYQTARVAYVAVNGEIRRDGLAFGYTVKERKKEETSP
jgi:hypothetical protein